MEDQVDDRKVHEVTQSVRKDMANEHGAVVEEVEVVDGVDMRSAAGCRFGVSSGKTEHPTVTHPVLGEDGGVDCVVSGGSGARVQCRAEPMITSLVKRVKNKPRREFRLYDYEYTGIFRRNKHNVRLSISKGIEAGVIYNMDDVDMEWKTWNGFGMNRKHEVRNLLSDDERKLVENAYGFDSDR